MAKQKYHELQILLKYLSLYLHLVVEIDGILSLISYNFELYPIVHYNLNTHSPLKDDYL